MVSPEFVVGHEDERVQPPAVGFHGSPQPIEAFVPVDVVTDDWPPLIAPRHHVVQCTGKLDSQGTRHARSIADPTLSVKH